MHRTYLALGLRTSATRQDVLRACWRAMSLHTRRDRRQHAARRAFYQRNLAHHADAQRQCAAIMQAGFVDDWQTAAMGL